MPIRFFGINEPPPPQQISTPPATKKCTYWRNHVTNGIRVVSITMGGTGIYYRDSYAIFFGLATLLIDTLWVNYIFYRYPTLNAIDKIDAAIDEENKELTATVNKTKLVAEELKEEGKELDENVHLLRAVEQAIAMEEGKLDAETSQFMATQQEIERATGEGAKRVKELSEEIQALKKLIVTLKNGLLQFKQENQELKRKIGQVHAENQALGKHTQELDAGTHRMQAAVTQDLEKIDKQFHQAEGLEKSIVEALQQQNRELEIKRQEMSQLAERSRATTAQIASQEARLERLHQEIKDSIHQLERLKREYAEFTRLHLQESQALQALREETLRAARSLEARGAQSQREAALSAELQALTRSLHNQLDAGEALLAKEKPQ